jgi:hypothetical protein
MSAQVLSSELERYLEMPSDERWKWLTRLLFALTQFARGTYTVGGTGLQQPERLRLYNELLHRIASQLRDKATSRHGMPDDVFVKVLAESIPSLDVNTDALIGMLK